MIDFFLQPEYKDFTLFKILPDSMRNSFYTDKELFWNSLRHIVFVQKEPKLSFELLRRLNKLYSTNSPISIYRTHINNSISSINNRNYEKAIEEANKAFEIASEANFGTGFAIFLRAFSKVGRSEEIKDIDEARLSYVSALGDLFTCKSGNMQMQLWILMGKKDDKSPFVGHSMFGFDLLFSYVSIFAGDRTIAKKDFKNAIENYEPFKPYFPKAQNLINRIERLWNN